MYGAVTRLHPVSVTLMRFLLLDRIVTLDPGRRIVTRKALTGAEEYLADHFPSFPVMPGVLMLEAMVQSAGWLVHATHDFRHSLVLLHEAKNVTYRSFVAPGDVLDLEVTARSIDAGRSTFTGVGRCGDEDAVKARLTLIHENLADGDTRLTDRDARMIARNREQFAQLGGPAALGDPQRNQTVSGNEALSA